MLTIALRGVVNNPFRYVATALAIVLGIAFFSATSVADHFVRGITERDNLRGIPRR